MMIIRQSEPSKYDQSPFGTVCKCMIDREHDTFEVYVQLSANEDIPRWDFVGSFPKNSLESDIEQAVFKRLNPIP